MIGNGVMTQCRSLAVNNSTLFSDALRSKSTNKMCFTADEDDNYLV